MKRIAFVTLLGSALAGPAFAVGFTGSTSPANFTVANTGTLVGGSPTLGTATFSATQLVMVGSDSTSPNPAIFTPGCSGGIYSTLASPCQLQVTINAPGAYAFNWSYVTADTSGPSGDIFGVIVDGKRIALSDLGGGVAQLGSASFAATASFGWFINCTDCIGGFANATVSSFVSSPVPEPATSAMWLAGLGAFGLCAWRRQAGGHAST